RVAANVVGEGLSRLAGEGASAQGSSRGGHQARRFASKSLRLRQRGGGRAAAVAADRGQGGETETGRADRGGRVRVAGMAARSRAGVQGGSPGDGDHQT